MVVCSPWTRLRRRNDENRCANRFAATVQIGLTAYENTETSPRAAAPLARVGNERRRRKVPADAKLYTAHVRRQMRFVRYRAASA
jgi:hypothetical protein